MNKIEVPQKNLDLEKLGLINQDLFEVNGDLARRYNSILKEVFGYECELDRFRIDKRGTSPEIADLVAEKYPDRVPSKLNYLSIGFANPYMIVVSPEQSSAPLVMPFASFESRLLDEIYRVAKHTIEDITAGEAMYGMIDNGITIFRSVEDLFGLRTLSVSLDTLEGTAHATAELKEKLEKLGERDESLGYFGLENALNPAFIDRVRNLVEKVGNPEARAISDIFPIKSEIHCFYAEFYNGVHCLRNFKNSDKIKGLFITNGIEKVRDFEAVTEIDIRDKDLLGLLHRYKFLEYKDSILQQRIWDTEDEMLLSENVDLVSLPEHKRTQLILQHRKKMPKIWHELSDIQTALLETSTTMEKIMSRASYEAKLKLSVPIVKKKKSKSSHPLEKHESSHNLVINHVLAELDTTDPVRLFKFNKMKFTTEFPKLPLNRQRYQVQKILEMKGGND